MNGWVDVHMHLGDDRIFGFEVTEEEIIRYMDEYNIETSIVQPCAGDRDPVRVHDRIAEMGEKHPGRIFGMASINPHQDQTHVRNELGRCLGDLGFVGVKCHTLAHAVIPPSADADVIFDTAEQHGVPVMTHVASFGQPFAAPGMLIPRAKQHDIPMVLAHMGASSLSPETIFIADEFDSMYLDMSWGMAPDVAWAIDQLGADRCMFATDLHSNMPVEVAKINSLDLTEEQHRKVVRETAIEVFDLDL